MSGVGGNIGVFKVCSSIGNSQHLADSSSKLEKSDLKKKYTYYVNDFIWTSGRFFVENLKNLKIEISAIQFLSFAGVETSSKAATWCCKICQ